MPKEYIYEPWTAPKSIQTKANCIIGKDYPMPGQLVTFRLLSVGMSKWVRSTSPPRKGQAGLEFSAR